jgi:hypothetical protein
MNALKMTMIAADNPQIGTPRPSFNVGAAPNAPAKTQSSQSHQTGESD